MDIETLAKQAMEIFGEVPWQVRSAHGFEVSPGFFTLYNEEYGQSKTVLLHADTYLVFKDAYEHPRFVNASERHLGTVTWDGITLNVRLPYNEFFAFSGVYGVLVQEYVVGEPCACENYFRCDHREDLRELTGFADMHRGNWKIQNDEVIIFDFDI